MKAETLENAYLRGKTETYPNYAIEEIAEAIREWKLAESDHGHTSYWGIYTIRLGRAYWLGRARGWRERNGAPFRAVTDAKGFYRKVYK